jgi:hypothetical protein
MTDANLAAQKNCQSLTIEAVLLPEVWPNTVPLQLKGVVR